MSQSIDIIYALKYKFRISCIEILEDETKVFSRQQLSDTEFHSTRINFKEEAAFYQV